MMGSNEVSAQQHYESFWPKVGEEIRSLSGADIKNYELPLARIKKIMKMDEDVKMISAEAPALFSKAAEMFITELTMRAWIHTEDNKRRTLQRNDIAMAASKYDQFDFLIDIVPRDENKPTAAKAATTTQTTTGTSNPTVQTSVQQGEQVVYYTPQQQQQQQIQQQQQQIQLQQQQQQQQAGGAMMAAPQVIQLNPAANMMPAVAQGGIQIITQIVGANGEIQQVPMALTPQQMDMIRNQISGGTQAQPLVIQTAPIQATSIPGSTGVQPQQTGGGQQSQQQQGQQQAQQGESGQQVYISE